MSQKPTPGAGSDRKRERDRLRIAAKRATMTPEERAIARAVHDRVYRESHREERLAYLRAWRSR